MSKKLTGAVSHHDREVEELRADRDLAVEYLKAAMESLDDPEDRAAGLLALRTVAEAYGGLGAIAAQADISRDVTLSCAFSQRKPNLEDHPGCATRGGHATVCRAGNSSDGVNTKRPPIV